MTRFATTLNQHQQVRHSGSADRTYQGPKPGVIIGHYSGSNFLSELAAALSLRMRNPQQVSHSAGYVHGSVAANLGAASHAHVVTHNLGRVFAAETGFVLSRAPDTVRAADVSFISSARLPNPPPRGFAELAPVLVVEVLSPDDYLPEVREKVTDWLKAGSRLVWMIDPFRTLAVCIERTGANRA